MNENHTQAGKMLEEKFKKPALNDSKTSKPGIMNALKRLTLSKKLAITISSIIGAITIFMLLFAILVSTGLVKLGFNNGSNVNNISSIVSVGSSSSQNSSINTSSVQETINFPRFFTSQAFSKSGSTATNSAQSNSSRQAINFESTIKPANFEKLKSSNSSFLECQNSTPVIENNIVLANEDGFKIVIGNKNLTVQNNEKSIYEFNKNFIKGGVNLMSDASSSWGPDFLNYFKESCNKVTWEKVSQTNENIKKNLSYFQNHYSQIEINYTNEFINYGYSFYAIKDDYIVWINKVFNYEASFTRAEKESCVINGRINKDCLVKIIKSNKINLIEQHMLEYLNTYKFTN